MTEEEKKTLDDLESVPEKEQTDEYIQNEEEAPEVQEQETEETPEQETERETEGEQPEEKSWADYGLPEFDRISKEEIAQRIATQNQIYGKQQNELGELRKEIEQLKQPKTEQKDEVAQMSEGQRYDFEQAFQDDPIKALDKHFTPQVAKRMKEQMNLDEVVDEKVNQRLEQVKYQDYIESNPEMQQYSGGAKTLDEPQHLGNHRYPIRDLHELAKLGTDRDPLYPSIYGLMKRYRMPFRDAKKFAEMQQNQSKSAEQDKTKVRQEVNKIDQSNSRSTKKKKSEKQPPPKSIDDIELD